MLKQLRYWYLESKTGDIITSFVAALVILKCDLPWVQLAVVLGFAFHLGCAVFYDVVDPEGKSR